MRIEPLQQDPLVDGSTYRFMARPWPASWIGPGAFDPDEAGVWAFRLRMERNQPGKQRVHVSADQRYHLYLNGARVGRGAERGDLRHWMYDSYDLELQAGVNVLVALVWWCGVTSLTPPPWAQQTQRPGWLVMAEGEDAGKISTGTGAWEARAIEAIAFDPKGVGNWHDQAIGWRIIVDGKTYPWGIERGQADGFGPARVIQPAAIASLRWESHPYWILRPSLLPAMRESLHAGATVRHVEEVDTAETESVSIDPARHRSDEAEAWNRMLTGQGVVKIPAQSRRRVVIDLNDYINAYTELTLDSGSGARVRVKWAEALFVPDLSGKNAPAQPLRKDNRSEIAGRYFAGFADTFIADGGADRSFQSLWWKAGRYLEVYVETRDAPLAIRKLSLARYEYPYHFPASFQSSDDRLPRVIPIALRTLQRCSFETSMDCPHYEQLNYTGDTRLQSLVAMTFSRDDRLARKSLLLFDWSRDGDTWTASRYPTRVTQTINTFSLWWVAMIHDYARYRGDMDFIRGFMPGARSILERWRAQIDERGLARLPAGWNFVDWVNGWSAGMSNPRPGSHCGIVQWQLIYTLRLMSELETMLNEPLLAQRNHQTAASLAACAERAFYDADRGLLADDESHARFSEHAQALAILSGHLSHHLREKIGRGLIESNDLAPASIYFSHYTFEALGKMGRTDALIERMKPWFAHEAMGLFTLPEEPEPSRSDCHAWGAHPLYHYFATILGVRPASFGFEEVEVSPQLGPLAWAEGKMTHPRGTIQARFERRGAAIGGEIILPENVQGRFRSGDRIVPLTPGANRID